MTYLLRGIPILLFAPLLAPCSGGASSATPDQIRLNDQPVDSLASLEDALTFDVVLPALAGFRLGVVTAEVPRVGSPGAVRVASEVQAFYRASSGDDTLLAIERAEPPNRDASYEAEQTVEVGGESAQTYLTPDGARTLAFDACGTAIDLRADAASWAPDRLAEVAGAFLRLCGS